MVIIKGKYITRIQKLKKISEHYISLWQARFFNPMVKSQLKNHKRIPIIIISFNQLLYLKQLVNFLLKRGYSNIVIIDNNSSYVPLIDYLNAIDSQVTVYRLKKNDGHLALWKNPEIFQKHCQGYYAVTDPDIVPIETCPDDFLVTFRKLLDRAYTRTKVGFSLKIDNLPDTNPNKQSIINWEAKYWTSKINYKTFKAEIDTTFALYRPNYSYQLKDFTKAWRTDYPIKAIHGGWYIDPNNLTEEQAHYIKTANVSASWQIDDSGVLVNKVHKTLYKNDR